MARMIPQSTITCDHPALQRALKAAARVAGKKHQLIQLRPDPNTGELTIAAVDTHVSFAATVTMHMCDLVIDRDEIIEIPLHDARRLAGFQIPFDPEEDPEPLAGLIIKDRAVTLTDETAVGIRAEDVERISLNHQATIGNPTRTISTARALDPVLAPGGHPAPLTPDQLTIAATITKIMGDHITPLITMLPGGHSQLLITADTWGLTTTARSGAAENTTRTDPTDPPFEDVPLPLSFDDTENTTRTDPTDPPFEDVPLPLSFDDTEDADDTLPALHALPDTSLPDLADHHHPARRVIARVPDGAA